MVRTDTTDPTELPSPLGLLFLGFTLILLNLHGTGLFPLNASILGSGIAYGGLGLTAVGLLAWRRGHSSFGAVAFSALGLFCLSVPALTIFPTAGLGQAPPAAANTAYFALWGVFTLVLFLGTFRFDRPLQLAFGLLLLFYLLLSTGYAADAPGLRTAAAWAGMLSGTAAMFSGLLRLCAAALRPLTPIGMEVRKRA